MHTAILIASLIGFVMAIAIGLVIAVALTEMDTHLYEGSTSHLPRRQFHSYLEYSEQQATQDGHRRSRRHFHYHS